MPIFREQLKLPGQEPDEREQESIKLELEIDELKSKIETLVARRDARYKELGMETAEEVRERMKSIDFYFVRNVSAEDLFAFLHPYYKIAFEYASARAAEKRAALTPKQREEIVRKEAAGNVREYLFLPYYVPITKKVAHETDYEEILEDKNNFQALFNRYRRLFGRRALSIKVLAADAFNRHGNRTPEEASIWVNDRLPSGVLGLGNEPLDLVTGILRHKRDQWPEDFEKASSERAQELEKDRRELQTNRYEFVEEFDDFSISEKLWADIIKALPGEEKESLLVRSSIETTSYVDGYARYLELTKDGSFKFTPVVENGRVVPHRWAIYKKAK